MPEWDGTLIRRYIIILQTVLNDPKKLATADVLNDNSLNRAFKAQTRQTKIGWMSLKSMSQNVLMY